MKLPAHLAGIQCRPSEIRDNRVIIRPSGQRPNTTLTIEQLWDKLDEQEQHNLMMIALITTGDIDELVGGGVLTVVGNFKLWADGEIYYERKQG